MKKRLLAILLAVVMLVQLLPMTVLAEEGSEDTVSAYLASFAGAVAVDGSASEKQWGANGKMISADGSQTRAFDILWDTEALYLLAIPGDGDDTLTFTAGEGSVTVTPESGKTGDARWDAAVEVKLPLSQVGVSIKNYGLEIPVSVTLGACKWEGNVIITSNQRIQKVSGMSRTQSGDDAANTSNLKTYFTEDGGMRFTRLYGNGDDTNAYDAAFYKMGAANFPELVDGLEHVSIEFDFVADAMPAYNEVHYVSGAYACHGFAASITDGENNLTTNKPDCISFGITNNNGALYFMVGHGYDRGTTGTVEAINTEKTLGEKFHVQLLIDNAGTMSLYVDGQFLRTFEGAVIDNYPLGGVNSSNIPVVRLANYGNPNIDGKKADGSADVDFTVSNLVIGNTQGNTLLDTLTFDTIKGENTSPDYVISDLVLPTKLENPQIPDVQITWSSSDETVISNDGKVKAASENKTVTVTATLVSDPTLTKSFELQIPKLTIDASLIDEEITLDGVLSEGSWSAAENREFAVATGATGKITALWKAYTAYFAVEYTDADTLELHLGDKVWSFALTESINEDGGTVTGTAKDGIAELKVDLTAAGIVMEDYNEQYKIHAILSSSTSSNRAELESAPITLIFSGDYYSYTATEISVQSPSLKGVAGSATTGWNADVGAWQHTSQNGGVAYWVKTGIAAMDHTRDVLTEIDMNITAAPVVTNPTSDGVWAGESVYIWVTDCDKLTGTNNTTNGYYSFAMIHNYAEGNLAITNRTKTKTLPLGVKVGQRFTLGYLWKTDDSVEVFVDGSSVGMLPVDTYYLSGGGNDAVQIRARSMSAEKVELNIYDVHVSCSGVQSMSLEEELAPAKVLAGVKLTGLTNDDTITLPGSFETKLGTMTLNWAANNSYITLTKNADGSYTGTVQQPNTKVDGYTHLTMSVGSRTFWKAEATIVGLHTNVVTTAGTLRVPFTAAGVKVDGATTDEGWSLDIKVVKDNAEAGVFGAQWTKDDLYMAVDTRGADLAVNINGKDIDLSNAATAGNITEFSVALADIGVTLEDYGEVLDVKITLGDATWEGKFILTSTDWFLTDGVEPRIKVGLKGSSGAYTANQGAEDLGNGWHLFDLYDPAGSNPANVRTYLIFWARGGTEEEMAVFRPLNDRTTPTYTEFDFLAKSMPVYAPGNGSNGATDWSNIFANYGVDWNVAADSDQPTGGNALSVSMGIYNSEEGLVFCVLGKETTHVPLKKFLGDQFRIGTSWNVDGSLTVYVDGEEIATVENAESIKNGYGDESLVINLTRNKQPAASAADSFDVYITNISIGKSRGESIFDALTIDDILGDNTDAYAVTTDLELMDSIYDDQLDISAPISWTISEPDTVAQGGAVTRPANGGKLVQLTASWNGHTKTFEVYVKGLNYTSDTRVVINDLDTAYGGGKLYDSYSFTLDTTNNSIVYDMGKSTAINLITLTDGDESNRLNESCLTIWVSDDNKTYTQVEGGFKIKKEGSKVYLYDFEATGRYIKVHCTHYLGTEADFTGPQEQMLRAEWSELLNPAADYGSVANGGWTVDVKNDTGETKYDETWTLGEPVEVGENMVVVAEINGVWEHLYFYTEGGSVHVRIPEVPANGITPINVWYLNDDILNLENKEYTLEVVYGTRETRIYDGAGRWIVELPDGRLLAINNSGDGVNGDVCWLTYSYSYNYGMTWTEPLVIDCTVGWLHNAGGVTYDPNNGRIIVEGYQYKQFVAGDVKSSDCKLRFVYSDDMGQTWTACPDVTFENGKSATYVLSYSDPVIVSSYDGEGPNIDMVLNNGVQYDDTGSFCCRVAFTRDAGKTWVLGDDEIRYTPGSGILAYEGGVSEGTILEVKDENGKGTGKLVLYARCQYDNVDVFCKAYSDDYGANWTTAAELSDLYTVNTQPIMHEFGDAQLMFWGGNNVLGGNSYQRMPMNVAISRDGLETFEGIQDLYARYSLQGMTTATRNQIINQSVANQGETVTLVWDNNFKETLILRVDNFTDWFYRTNGIWDSFEYTTTKAEGWSTTSGGVSVSDAYALDGGFSMKMNAASSAVRSVPYLQNGTVSFDMYLFKNPKFQLELESAYGTQYGKAAPIGFTYEDGAFVFLGSDTAYSVELKENDWNNFTFTLDLDAETPVAVLAVNGQKVADVPVNTEVGDYVCWLDINTSSVIYLDCLHVDDTDPVEVPEKQQKPAESQTELPRLSVSLSLNETIDMNFYAPEAMLADGARVVVKCNGQLLEEGQYRYDLVGNRYRVRVSINANRMSDVYSVQVVDAQGKPLSQDRVMSVRSYAMLRLKNPTAPEYERRAILKMLDYGALAQLCMDENAGELANRHVTAEMRDALEMKQWPTAATEPDAPIGSTAESKFSVSLTMNETVDMNLYINASEVKDGYTIQVKRNGVVLKEGTGYTLTRSGDRWRVRVMMNADKMCDVISVQLLDADGQPVYPARALSIRNYAQLRLANAKASDMEKRLIIAMLDYGALSQLCVNSAATDLANRYVTDADRALFDGFEYPHW